MNKETVVFIIIAIIVWLIVFTGLVSGLGYLIDSHKSSVEFNKCTNLTKNN